MKIGEWNDNSKEPLQELEEVQFCMPDPHSGWTDWQEMIVAYTFADGPDEFYFEHVFYYPEKQKMFSLSGNREVRYEKGEWQFTSKTNEFPTMRVLVYAYFPISPMPNFDNSEGDE